MNMSIENTVLAPKVSDMTLDRYVDDWRIVECRMQKDIQ